MVAAAELTQHFRERRSVRLPDGRRWLRHYPADDEAEEMLSRVSGDAEALLLELGDDLRGCASVTMAVQQAAFYRQLGDYYAAEAIAHRGKKFGQGSAVLAKTMHKQSNDAIKAAREAATAIRERRAKELTADGHEVFSEAGSPPEAPPGVCSGAPSPPQPTTKDNDHGCR